MGYRSSEEVKQWKMRDPVAVLRRELAANLDQSELERLEAGVEAEIRSALPRPSARSGRTSRRLSA